MGIYRLGSFRGRPRRAGQGIQRTKLEECAARYAKSRSGIDVFVGDDR